MVKGILVNRRSDETTALRSQLKMEHADLIAEMQTIENLPTHERLQLARIRRAQQLKVARQKEKEWLKLERIKGNCQNLYNSNGGGPVGNRAFAGSNRTYSNTLKNDMDVVFGRRHISFENSVVLLEAASRNDMQEVAELLEAGITPDAANEDGLTALHQCCIDNNVDMLKLLLEYGANVDAQDSDKWTPLHAAATCGHLELVRILIDRGANLLAVNTDGNMPYDLCDDEKTLDFIEAEMSKRGVTQELIDETRSATECQMLKDLMEIAHSGGDLEEPDHQGATPLHIASANGYVRVVEFLLEMHVNVDTADNDLWTPVHAAACWGHLEVLEMLSQFGADLNVRNKDNETPSDICEDPEIRERIEQLKTEQESKRLAEAQRRRVRRSQSNNTRAQSVRRTSLRDKTLTTKKDAVEEARLRLQAQEVFTVGSDSTTLDTNSIDVGTQASSTLASCAMSSLCSYSSSAGDVNTYATNATDCQKRLQTAQSVTNQLRHNQNHNNNNNNYINNHSSTNRHCDIQNLKKNVGDGGVGDMRQQSSDTVDTTFLARRPADGRDAFDDEHLVNSFKTIECTETVQVQSSKKTTNGKINVQVTVLVDTTQDTSPQAQTSVQKNQQQIYNNTANTLAQTPIAENAVNKCKNYIDLTNHGKTTDNNNTINDTSGNNNNHSHICNRYANINNEMPNNNNNNNNNASSLLLPFHHNSLSGGATLANLKKQRSLSRTNVFNSENGSVVGTGAATGIIQPTAGNLESNNNNSQNNNNQHVENKTSTSQQNSGSSSCSNTKTNHNNNNNNNSHKSLTAAEKTTAIETNADTATTTLCNNRAETMGYNQTTLLDFQRVPLPHNNNVSSDVAENAGVIKFSGVPSDVVGDSTNSRRCCTLM